MAKKPGPHPQRVTETVDGHGTSRSNDAVDPRHRWDRPLQAPGHMQVDFEERVDFRRLNAYRLGRTR